MLSFSNSPALTNMLTVARINGCPPDQVLRFARAGLLLQPRQLAASAAARLCDQPGGPTAIGYGGARGGGKSFWLLAQMGADDCQRMPGLKCLLLRKVGKANLEHFEDLRRRLFGALPHHFAASRGILTFANGSRIVAGHFQDESDIDSYLGLEYDVIGVEEATTLTERKYQDISTCNRSANPLWRPRMYSTTNPGGVGHDWYRRMFVVPFQAREETETHFIPARVDDNRFTNPEYRRVLERLPGWQRRAWLDGDWNIAAGQFFANFRRDTHVISDFSTSGAREWFAAMDYGYTHYTVVLLGCADQAGRIYVLDEHAARRWLPGQHAEAIRAMLHRHGLDLFAPASSARSGFSLRRFSLTLNRFVAGTDVFSCQSDGSTVADQYATLRIHLEPANTERVNGWADLLHRLGDPAGGIAPSLFIHERCRRLIDTLPCLQHDPYRPEDVLKVDVDENGTGGDDAADACRYLVHSRPYRAWQTRLTGF